jgi:hypothetical protein
MNKGLGTPKGLNGKGGTSLQSTLVPVNILQALKSLRPLPITVSGSNQITFTVAGSTTSPVSFWNGNDVIDLKESKTYTWTTGSNAILSSAGVETTQTGSTLGIWYFYMGLDSSGNLDLIPSQTAPSYVENSYEHYGLGHPGTSQGQYWNYVGFQLCTSASGAGTYKAMTKIGYTYTMTDTNKITAATPGTSFAATMGGGAKALPALEQFGSTVAGYLETGAAAIAHIASNSTGDGEIQANCSTTGETINAPFSGISPSGGDVYSKHTTAAGDVHITQIVDIV